VADGPIQDHDPVTTHAYLDGRVNAAAVKVDGRSPNPLHRFLRHSTGGWVLLLAHSGYGVKVPRQIDPPQRVRQAG
jgi:hypothetical protein